MKTEITQKDRKILKDLAKHLKELASRPSEDEKRKLWYKHNALEPTRPLIFCDPENGWKEIITPEVLQCETELAREWEFILRKEIFWGEKICDDKVIEPYFNIPYIFTESDWGLEVKIISSEERGSFRWDAPLKDYDQMENLHFPEIVVDYKTTKKLFCLAEDLFGEFLTVRIKGNWFWSLGVMRVVAKIRGIEEFMLDMYDNPDKLHSLIKFVRDGHLAKLNFLEQNNLLSLNNDGTYVGSGGFGYTNELPQKDFSGKVRTSDLWGFAESQETVYVSPQMYKEFVFPYEYSILERFGLNCYGCCEPLDKRWDIVKNFPRLRRVSVSPWANIKDMAEKLSKNYIYSMKPHPADLAVPQINKDEIRKKLKEAIKITKNCRVEIIMKDTHTIGGNPQNVIDWTKIAKEEAENI